MGLGKRKSSGEFLPALKFDARIGEFYLNNKVRLADGYEINQQTIERSAFKAIFDLEHATVGWMKFAKGEAPDLLLVPIGDDYGKAPSVDHKEGVRVICLLDPSINNGSIRELMSTSVMFWDGFSVLHDAYLEGLAEHPDELPEVVLDHVTEISTSNGKSYIPAFRITDWVERPLELSGPAAIAAKSTTKQATKPITKSTTKSTTTNQYDGGDMDDEIPF